MIIADEGQSAVYSLLVLQSCIIKKLNMYCLVLAYYRDKVCRNYEEYVLFPG